MNFCSDSHIYFDKKIRRLLHLELLKKEVPDRFDAQQATVEAIYNSKPRANSSEDVAAIHPVS